MKGKHALRCTCGDKECHDVTAWFVFGVTKSGFAEFLGAYFDEELAKRSADYWKRNDAVSRRRIECTYIEEREMNHGWGNSMFGIGKLPRSEEDLA